MLFLILWAVIVIIPIAQIIISSFNGEQANILIIGGEFSFSFKHFKTLFEDTLYLKWMANTLFVSISTVILVILIVSFTGYAYSRYRFKGKKASLMTVMLIQTIPTFAEITAYFTMYSIASDIMPGFTRQMNMQVGA